MLFNEKNASKVLIRHASQYTVASQPDPIVVKRTSKQTNDICLFSESYKENRAEQQLVAQANT